MGEPVHARPASLMELAEQVGPPASHGIHCGCRGTSGHHGGVVLSTQYASHLKLARDGADLDAFRATTAAKAAGEEREKALALAEKLKESLATEELGDRRQARAVLDRVLRALIDEWLVKLPHLTTGAERDSERRHGRLRSPHRRNAERRRRANRSRPGDASSRLYAAHSSVAARSGNGLPLLRKN